MFFNFVSICSFIFFYNKFSAESNTIHIETFVIGGDYIKIDKAPYSVAVIIDCSILTGASCGGSIVNQRVVLTAAHCLDVCPRKMSEIVIIVGNENKQYGDQHITNKCMWHNDYDAQSLHNDIGLIFLENNLKLGSNINRVAIVKNPPYDMPAFVAGWGAIDEDIDINTNILKGSFVEVHSRNSCSQYMKELPLGVICAGSLHNKHYVSPGDAGSALVVTNYIQIGLLSFKNTSISRSLVVYTDISYYYDWIVTNAKKGFC